MSEPAYLALDWGTTNRRAYVMADDGTVLGTDRDDHGVTAVEPDAFPAELAALRKRFGKLPVLAAGMIGSTRGWREAPYVAAPAGYAELAASLVQVPGEDMAIVPGVSLDRAGHADVMRGEELQVLGAITAGLAPADALLFHPGTHNKWVWMAGGRIIDFVTAMTGEVFALLRKHSILREMLGGEVSDGPAFRDGVGRAAAGHDLLSALFEVRAAVLLGRRAPADAAAYASGLLIGTDVAARDVARAGLVHIVADATLGGLYGAAIAELGGRSVPVDSHAAFAAGIHRIRELTA